MTPPAAVANISAYNFGFLYFDLRLVRFGNPGAKEQVASTRKYLHGSKKLEAETACWSFGASYDAKPIGRVGVTLLDLVIGPNDQGENELLQRGQK